MSNIEKRVIFLNTIFNFGATLVSTFISVYLYLYTNSIPLMSLYIIVRIGLFPVFFILGNKLSRKYPFLLTFVLGLSLITCSLIFLLFNANLLNQNPYLVLVVAFLVGCGEGFFYFSDNTCNQIVSSLETRTSFFSYSGVFNNLASIFAPLYATFILSNSKDELLGYRNILFSIIVIFLFVIIIAFSLKLKSNDKKISLLNSFSLKDKMWRDHCLAVIFYGLRNSLELNTINILIFSYVTDSVVYSKVQVFFSILTMIIYRIIIGYMTKDKIEKTFKMGVIFKMMSLIILILVPNIIGAIIYGILKAFDTATYDNAYNIISANIIGNYKEELTSRVVARESYLSLGRCLAMAFIILCYFVLPKNYYIQIALLLLNIAPIFVERLLIKYK